MPNSAAMVRCSSLRCVLSTLSARWSSQLNSTVNNDLIRLSVVSIFALFILLGTNQGYLLVGCQYLPELNEGTNDGNVHLSGPVASQHRGEHGNPLFGKGIRGRAAASPT